MKMRLHLKPVPEINMIPMIDVIMMLLIFFLVATQMKKEETSIQLALPESLEALLDMIDKNAPAPMMVNILPKSEGGERYMVAGQAMGKDELGRVLLAQAKKQKELGGQEASVRIRADKDAELADVQNALMACQKAMVVKVYIAAERPRG